MLAYFPSLLLQVSIPKPLEAVLAWEGIVLGILWLILIYVFAISIRNTRYKNDPTARFFILGLTAKMIGGITLGILYLAIWEGRDTYVYYSTAKGLFDIFFDSLEIYYKMMLNPGGRSNPERIKFIQENYNYYAINIRPYMHGFPEERAYFTSKLISLFAFPAFGFYMPMVILMAFVSFAGNWAMFRVFVKRYPQLEMQFLFLLLLLPSLVFWGSGMLKDTFSFLGVGLAFYGLDRIVNRKRKLLLNFLLVAFGMYLAYKIKTYIALAFLPLGVFWVVNSFYSFKGFLALYFVRPAVVLVGFGIGYLTLNTLSDGSSKFGIENVLDQSVLAYNDLTKEYYYDEGGGSRYDLGEIDNTLTSFLSKMPLAVFTAYYRPMIWESNSLQVLISGVETFALLLFSLYLIYKGGVLQMLYVISQNKLLVFLLLYCLLFGMMVGITSGNFGNLVRYRLPAFPFFFCLLTIASYEAQLLNQERRAALARLSGFVQAKT